MGVPASAEIPQVDPLVIDWAVTAEASWELSRSNIFPSRFVASVDSESSAETWFFRDIYPFEQLRLELLPRLIAARAGVRRLRFWSAGCGTGQEAYSLAMALRHHFPQLQDWDIEILGTDLLDGSLEKARTGLYSQQEINKGLPIVFLMKYFTQEGLEWRLNEDLRGKVKFQAQRLDQAWPELPSFDVILLRNVLFSFAEATRLDILGRVRDQLAVDGALLLGHSEKSDLKEGLEQVECGKGWYYRRPSGAESVLRAS